MSKSCCSRTVWCQEVHTRTAVRAHTACEGTWEGTEHVCVALQRSEVFPNERQPWRRPLAYYYLHAQLTAPWEAHSLLAEAPAASTTGAPMPDLQQC